VRVPFQLQCARNVDVIRLTGGHYCGPLDIYQHREAEGKIGNTEKNSKTYIGVYEISTAKKLRQNSCLALLFLNKNITSKPYGKFSDTISFV
jgi:hypothetical protein